jgi:hypothetical protein
MQPQRQLDRPAVADKFRLMNLRYAVWGIVLLTLVHLCWLQSQPGSGLRSLYAVTIRSSSSHTALAPFQQLDRITGQTTNANVLLLLAGGARTNSAVENSLSFTYFRANYILYPRRMYAAPAHTVINRGGDIQRLDFNPDRQWLQSHDIHWVLTLGRDSAGGAMVRLEPFPPPDNPAGVSAGKTGGN